MYIYLKELIYSKWKELRFVYNYTKLSSLNLVLERFVKKGVIQSSLYFYSLIKSKTLLECSNESSFPLFFHPVESKPLCESGRSRREETLQGHLVLLYGPDNGPFVRHCILATLIVSLKPDDLRGYETAPPSSFPYLTVPFLFWHPFCIESLVRGWSRVDEPEEEELKFEIEGVEKKWKVNQFYKGLLFIFFFPFFHNGIFFFFFFFYSRKENLK